MYAPAAVDLVGFAYIIWATGLQFVICMVLAYFVARRKRRSVLNWLFVGFLCGAIPVVGILLMIGAYFWYPDPAPKTGPGSQPRRRPDDGPRERR